MGTDTPWLSSQTDAREVGGKEMKGNEMRYTPKELQSIVGKHVQPSRQQERQKIAKEK
jgi:hypothetical protein